MKKVYATLFALLALSLVSCSDSSDPIVPDPEPTPTPTSQNQDQVLLRKVGQSTMEVLCCKDSHGILITTHNGKY